MDEVIESDVSMNAFTLRCKVAGAITETRFEAPHFEAGKSKANRLVKSHGPQAVATLSANDAPLCCFKWGMWYWAGNVGSKQYAAWLE